MRAALLAISAYALPVRSEISLDDPNVERHRAQWGGQLSPPPTTQTRWYAADVERAEVLADQGNLQVAGELMRASDRDGVIQGALAARSGGLVRLPKVWVGDETIIAGLRSGSDPARSTFDEMCPASELERLDVDGIRLGVGVGELVPVEGRAFPVLVRRSPEYLVFKWTECQWYFRSAQFGLIPITPGDGRWVLHTPGGREAPWQSGIWRALGRAFIRKDHAQLHRDNWEGKLANPARVAVSPAGATEEQRQSWFRKVMAWGVNTVFGLLPGWDVKLLESNGRGYESFGDTIEEADGEINALVRGQTVTADGGVGFANAETFRSIEADLIQRDGNGLAHTINTQILPAYVLNVHGEDALARVPSMGWDTTPAIDQKATAEALGSAATAITTLAAALEPFGLALDARKLISRFNVPVDKLDKPLASNVVPLRRDPAPAAARAA